MVYWMTKSINKKQFYWQCTNKNMVTFHDMPTLTQASLALFVDFDSQYTIPTYTCLYIYIYIYVPTFWESVLSIEALHF